MAIFSDCLAFSTLFLRVSDVKITEISCLGYPWESLTNSWLLSSFGCSNYVSFWALSSSFFSLVAGHRSWFLTGSYRAVFAEWIWNVGWNQSLHPPCDALEWLSTRSLVAQQWPTSSKWVEDGGMFPQSFHAWQLSLQEPPKLCSWSHGHLLLNWDELNQNQIGGFPACKRRCRLHA